MRRNKLDSIPQLRFGVRKIEISKLIPAPSVILRAIATIRGNRLESRIHRDERIMIRADHGREHAKNMPEWNPHPLILHIHQYERPRLNFGDLRPQCIDVPSASAAARADLRREPCEDKRVPSFDRNLKRRV